MFDYAKNEPGWHFWEGVLFRLGRRPSGVDGLSGGPNQHHVAGEDTEVTLFARFRAVLRPGSPPIHRNYLNRKDL